MTTLAYRSGILASDSLVTSGGARSGLTARKIRRVGGALVAGCGFIGELERFISWVAAGMTGDDPLRGGETNALLIAPGQPLLMFGSTGPWAVEADFVAMGSGEDFAFGAMAYGASAIEAIEVAIRFDVYSGGPIQTLKL